MNKKNFIFATLFLSTFGLSSEGSAKSLSTDHLTISGHIPLVLSSSIQLNQAALVFRPEEKVRNRVIGRITFRYNTTLQAIEISSNRAHGVPAHDVYGPYPFGPYGFDIKIGNCPGLNPQTTSPISFSETAYSNTNIGNGETLTTGVVASCDILGSWDGASSQNAPSVQNAAYTVDYFVSLSPAL